MISLHILEKNDGVQRADGVRGYVASAGTLSYTARWSDGSTTEHEQGDPEIDGFEWEGDTYDDDRAPMKDELFLEIQADWRFWRKAGPRPETPPQNIIYPVESNA